MDKLTPVDITTLQERVYLRLRSAISQGDFAPGEVLTIRTLAASLGTSAMPVREALQRLVAEKALIQQPNRSIVVPPFTVEGHRELIRIRTAIESFAARQAALRTNGDLVERLRRQNVKMREAVERKDPEKVLDANRAFHFALYSGSQMPQLLDIIEGLWLRTGPYLGAAIRKIPGADQHFLTGTSLHERVIQAIEKGDTAAAGRALSLDLWFTARRFLPVMAELNGPPGAALASRRQSQPA
ncbi:MAG: GntR family transcriptional regulator [Rhizobiales bacterium]|nr:GntR family transcriptional regulator [Hyphomicrobiales bacterium]